MRRLLDWLRSLFASRKPATPSAPPIPSPLAEAADVMFPTPVTGADAWARWVAAGGLTQAKIDPYFPGGLNAHERAWLIDGGFVRRRAFVLEVSKARSRLAAG